MRGLYPIVLIVFLLQLLQLHLQVTAFLPRLTVSSGWVYALKKNGGRTSGRLPAAAPAATVVDTEDDASLTWTSLKSILRGTNVYFIGMMGSGKSSVGNEFAKNLGYRFLDTDEIAEFMIEMPIADFFAQGKEAQFRDLEYQILMEMAQYTRLVLSTGGGTVERNENWGLLHHGIVVFLDLSPEHIIERLSANPEQLAKRPLLQGPNPLAKLQELSEKRMDKYTQGDVKVKVPPKASNGEVSLLAAQAILRFIEDNPPLWKEWKKKRDQKAQEVVSKVTSGDTRDLGTNNILQ